MSPEEKLTTPPIFKAGDKNLDRQKLQESITEGLPYYIEAYGESLGSKNVELLKVALDDLMDSINKGLAYFTTGPNDSTVLHVDNKKIPEYKEGDFNPYREAAYLIKSVAEITPEVGSNKKKFKPDTFNELLLKNIAPTGAFDSEYWENLDEVVKDKHNRQTRPYTNRLNKFVSILDNIIKEYDTYDEVDESLGTKEEYRQKLLDLRQKFADGNISADDLYEAQKITGPGIKEFFREGVSYDHSTEIPYFEPGTKGYVLPDSDEGQRAIAEHYEKYGPQEGKEIKYIYYVVDDDGIKRYYVRYGDKESTEKVADSTGGGNTNSTTGTVTENTPEVTKDPRNKTALSDQEYFAQINRSIGDPDWKDWTRIGSMTSDVIAGGASFFGGLGTAISAVASTIGLVGNTVADFFDPTVSSEEAWGNVKSNALFALIGLLPGGKLAKFGKAGKAAKSTISAILKGIALYGAYGQISLIWDGDENEVRTLYDKLAAGDLSKLTKRDLYVFSGVVTGLTTAAMVGGQRVRQKRNTNAAKNYEKTNLEGYDIKVKKEVDGKTVESTAKVSKAQRDDINNEGVKRGLAAADAKLREVMKENGAESEGFTLNEGKFTEKGYEGNYKDKYRSATGQGIEKVEGTKTTREGMPKTYAEYIRNERTKNKMGVHKWLRDDFEIYQEGYSPIGLGGLHWSSPEWGDNFLGTAHHRTKKRWDKSAKETPTSNEKATNTETPKKEGTDAAKKEASTMDAKTRAEYVANMIAARHNHPTQLPTTPGQRTSIQPKIETVTPPKANGLSGLTRITRNASTERAITRHDRRKALVAERTQGHPLMELRKKKATAETGGTNKPNVKKKVEEIIGTKSPRTTKKDKGNEGNLFTKREMEGKGANWRAAAKGTAEKKTRKPRKKSPPKKLEGGRLELLRRYLNGGFLIPKAQAGKKVTYDDVVVPEWFIEENPYPALLGWNETLDSSAAGQQITSAGAMHSHAGDLKTAYGKNNAYIGNYEAQLLDIRSALENILNNSSYENMTIDDLVNSYNGLAENVRQFWKREHSYNEPDDEDFTGGQPFNNTYNLLFSSRGNDWNGNEQFYIGFDPKISNTVGSSTWLRRMDVRPDEFDPENEEHLRSRVFEVQLKDGSWAYVYKKKNGDLGIIKDPALIERIVKVRDSKKLENVITDGKVNGEGSDISLSKDKIDPKKLSKLTLKPYDLEANKYWLLANALGAGRLLGDIAATNSRAARLSDNLRGALHLKQTAHKYHQVMDDYAGNQAAFNQAAAFRNRYKTAVSSDQLVNDARIAEAENKAYATIEQPQIVRNQDMIQKHTLVAENYANENKLADANLANENGAALSTLATTLANIEQQRSAINQQSIDNYLMGIEKDIRQRWIDKKAIMNTYVTKKIGTINERFRRVAAADLGFLKARIEFAKAVESNDEAKIREAQVKLQKETERVMDRAIAEWDYEFTTAYGIPYYKSLEDAYETWRTKRYQILNPTTTTEGITLATPQRAGGATIQLRRGGSISDSTSRANSLDITLRERSRIMKADNDRFMKSIWKAIDAYLELSKRLYKK